MFSISLKIMRTMPCSLGKWFLICLAEFTAIIVFCSLNTEESCGRLQWLGNIKETGNHRLAVTTHTEDLQIWDVEEAAVQHSFSREQVKEALKVKPKVSIKTNELLTD